MFFGTATWTFSDGAYVEAPFANKWIIDGADTDNPKIVLFQAFAVSANRSLRESYFMTRIQIRGSMRSSLKSIGNLKILVY